MKTLLLLLLVVLAGGCATPKEIEGHKVTGTRWVDGKVVYSVEESEADRAKMKADAKQAEEAGQGVTFAPAK